MMASLLFLCPPPHTSVPSPLITVHVTQLSLSWPRSQTHSSRPSHKFHPSAIYTKTLRAGERRNKAAGKERTAADENERNRSLWGAFLWQFSLFHNRDHFPCSCLSAVSLVLLWLLCAPHHCTASPGGWKPTWEPHISVNQLLSVKIVLELKC